MKLGKLKLTPIAVAVLFGAAQNIAAQQPYSTGASASSMAARGSYYADVVRQAMGGASPTAMTPATNGFAPQAMYQQSVPAPQMQTPPVAPVRQPYAARPYQNPPPRSPVVYNRSAYPAVQTAANQPTLAPPIMNESPSISVGQMPTLAAPTSMPASQSFTAPSLSFPAEAVPSQPTWGGAGFAAGGPSAAAPSGNASLLPPATTAWPTAAAPYGGYSNYAPPFNPGDLTTTPDPAAGFIDPTIAAAQPMNAGCPTCGPWFVSLTGLIMTRDAPNNVGLAFFNGEPQISVLNTEEAGMEWSGGFEARVGRMLGNRWAAEVVYWMLDPMESFITVRSLNDDITSRLDFDQLPNLDTIFFNSREQQLYRYNAFQNIEINLLQQALVVDPAGRYGLSFLTGVRYFRFDEVLNYRALAGGHEFSEQNSDFMTIYDIHMHNKLIGLQTGARAHVFLGNRLRAYAMPRVGVFSNTISQRQIVCRLVDLNDRKTDVALLGQLDLGLAYQLFNCCSIFGGYRVMGIAGVANADDQFARTLGSLPDMASINSSGSIILHGATAGVQIQF